MPSQEIVDGFIEHHLVGTTTTTIANKNPILFMKVNGVPTGSAYVVQDQGTSKRTIFPRLSGTNIYLTGMGQVYGSTLQSLSLNIEIFLGIHED
jgi:hypothetical protein